jgi:cellulose synthase/poly-beta-1,6-N-acetylglucosamine synthase-like glycosyltransferase
MFISLYFLAMFLLIYLKNKREIFTFPKAKKKYSVSFVVPIFNEEKTIEDTLKHIFAIDYDLEEVILVNDCSTDRSLDIIKKMAGKYPKVRVIDHKKNLGKAESINDALKIVKSELVSVVDADSYPATDSLKKMVGYFEDQKVGAVTCVVIARNTNKFIERLQAIEYKMIALTRKLLDYVEAIYVTPGPLAIYRKKALDEIGGFDKKNMTEDIEVTWHLTYAGWKRKMCLSTTVSSTVPNKIRSWFRQRRRWNVGGLQCISKYRKDLFNPKKGMLGFFIIPFFILSTFLGLLGLSIFFYIVTRKAISNFLYARYTIVATTPLLTLEDVYITPTILNYLGIAMFFLGFIFLLIVFAVLKEKVLKKENILNIPFYMIIYMAFYPFIMLTAIGHIIRGKRVWR